MNLIIPKKISEMTENSKSFIDQEFFLMKTLSKKELNNEEEELDEVDYIKVIKLAFLGDCVKVLLIRFQVRKCFINEAINSMVNH